MMMTPLATPLIRIENAVISYGNDPIISGLSTTIESGTFVGLIGPNGAGKTTLLMSMSGQLRPLGGHIYLNDEDVYESNLKCKRNVGYVHDNPFFYPYLTAEDSLRFVASVRNVHEQDAKQQIRTLLTVTDMWDERDKLTSALSLGMRKKLAIAASMIGEPRVLFLDEALSGIEPASAFRIKRTLREFVSAGGIVVLSTHVMEAVETMCDRYLVLAKGKVVADLRAEDISGVGSVRVGSDLEEYITRLLADDGVESDG
jgi:ABC-2 type transport system ATP-binding protein